MDGRMDRRMDGRTDKRKYILTNGRADRQMETWTNSQMDPPMRISRFRARGRLGGARKRHCQKRVAGCSQKWVAPESRRLCAGGKRLPVVAPRLFTMGIWHGVIMDSLKYRLRHAMLYLSCGLATPETASRPSSTPLDTPRLKPMFFTRHSRARMMRKDNQGGTRDVMGGSKAQG
jgi:hypothetical protein